MQRNAAEAAPRRVNCSRPSVNGLDHVDELVTGCPGRPARDDAERVAGLVPWSRTEMGQGAGMTEEPAEALQKRIAELDGLGGELGALTDQLRRQTDLADEREET